MEIAKHTPGSHRFKWFWDQKYYTPHGVEVPEEVWKEDERLMADGQEIAPDDQVLNMVVTLPAEALPPPFVLSTLPGEPDNTLPAEDDEEEEVEEDVEEETPEGQKVITKKTVKRKKAAKRK